jgi:hypothetical protein
MAVSNPDHKELLLLPHNAALNVDISETCMRQVERWVGGGAGSWFQLSLGANSEIKFDVSSIDKLSGAGSKLTFWLSGWK